MDEAGNVAVDRKELLAMHRGSSRHLKVEEYRCGMGLLYTFVYRYRTPSA